MTDGLPGLVGPDIPFGHKIVVRSVPCTGELIAYVEILGVLRVGGRLAKARTSSDLVEHIYAYDLDSQSDRSREFSISAPQFEHQDCYFSASTAGASLTLISFGSKCKTTPTCQTL